MNLQSMTLAGVEPAALQAALRRRFSVVTRQNDCRVYPYSIVARDDSGRVRLRIAYLFSQRLWSWVYCILPGDRHE
jgi:hypothetical protein